MTDYERLTRYVPREEDAPDEEIVRDGDLAAYLRDEFLAGYLARQPEKYAQIPDMAVEVLLNSVFTIPEIDPVELSGSVPKCIAAGVPEGFWNISAYYDTVVRQLPGHLQEHSTEGELARSLAGAAAADMDIKLRGGNEVISDVFMALAREYGVPADAIREFRDEDIPASEANRVRQFEFEYPDSPGWKIVAEDRPVKTNPKRQMMIVSFVDTATDRTVFHLDIGELPSSADAVRADNRQGTTSNKQDLVVARLRKVGGTDDETASLQYAMGRQAVDVMHGQDAVITRSHRPNRVLEISLRSWRMNLLHEMDSLELRDGSTLPLPQLDMLLPTYEAEALFGLRRHLQTLAIAEDTAERRPVPMIPRRELALCLTIDPYTTIQALRDSGVALLIPGLRHVSYEQWNRVLRAESLLVGPYRTTEADRNTELMMVQRELYMHGRNGKTPRQYNGVSLFVHALKDANVIPQNWTDDDLTLYVQLWEESDENQQDTMQTLLNRARMVVFHAAQGTPLESVYRRAASQPQDGTVFDFEYNTSKSRWDAAAALYTLLHRFPAGLTAQELEYQYYANFDGIPRVKDFRGLFYDLKLLGVVRRHPLERITQHRNRTSVDLYTLSSEPSRKQLLTIASDHRFQEYLITTNGHENGFGNTVRDLVTFALQQLPNYGVMSIDTLESFTRDDYNLMPEMPGRDPESLARIGRLLLDHYAQFKATWDR